MDILIRKATLKDQEDIQNLNLRLFKKEHKEFDKTLNLKWTFSKAGTQYYQEHITGKNSFAAVAVVEGKTVGYICCSISDKPPKGEDYRNIPRMAEMEDMLVLDEFRSQGIGARLYDEFLKWCKSKKVKKLKLQVTTKNEKAIGFYRKLGFEDHTLVMEKDL